MIKLTTITTFSLLLILLITTLSTHPGLTRADPNPNPTGAKPKGGGHHHGGGGGGGGFFGPGSRFGIPGFDHNWGSGGGYGFGFGGPKGGYSKDGSIRPTVVCKDKGPCYMKKLTCPAKCFSSFSSSGKGYGGGGGGGGCTMDCKNKCIAYC